VAASPVHSQHATHICVPHRAHFIEVHVAGARRLRTFLNGLTGLLRRIRNGRVLEKHVKAADSVSNALFRGWTEA
jgi:hypothetical protein